MSNPVDNDILDVLDDDHQLLLSLVVEAEENSDAGLLPAYCGRLVDAAVRHFAATEIFLLPLLPGHVDGGGLIEQASVLDHRTVEDVLRRLEGMALDVATARPVLDEAAAALRAHVAQRHELLFPELRRVSASQQLHDLGVAVLGLEQVDPTGRPGPPGHGDVILVPGYVDTVRDRYLTAGRNGVPGTVAGT